MTLPIPVACPASRRVLNPKSIDVPPAIRAFQKPGMLLIVYFVPTWLTSWAFHTVVISNGASNVTVHPLMAVVPVFRIVTSLVVPSVHWARTACVTVAVKFWLPVPPVVPPPPLPTAVPLSLTFWTAVSVPGSKPR